MMNRSGSNDTREPMPMAPDAGAIGMGNNNILIRAFFVLFFLMMLCAVAVGLIRLPQDAVFYEVTFTLLHLAALFFLCCAISRVTLRNQKKLELLTLGCIILAGVILRCVTLHFMQTQPVSDFNKPHEFYRYYQERGSYLEKVPWDQRDKYQLYYSKVPAWFTYMRVVMIIYDLLGERLLWIYILNMILASGTILLIYLILPDKRAALMGAALLAFNPSMIFYSCITTPDHFTAFLLVLTIFFWMRGEKYRMDWPHSKKIIPYAVGAVTCCFLVNWFKPLSVFFIIAFICYESAMHLYPAIREKLPIKELWERVISYEMSFLILLSGGIWVGNAALNAQVESMLKTDVVNIMGDYLIYGANMGEDEKSTMPYDKEQLMEQYNMDLEKVYSEINKMVPEQMKKYLEHPFSLLGRKFGVAFWHELNFFAIANTSASEEYAESVDELLNTPVTSVMLTHMRLLYFLSALCAAYFVFGRKADKMVLLTAIIIFGYVLVLLFGEVQGRYKSLVVPLWCMISGYTVFEVLPEIRQRCQSLRKTRN